MAQLPIRIAGPGDLEAPGRLLAILGVGLTLVDRNMRVQWANEFVRNYAEELSCGSDHCFSALWHKESRCSDCLPVLVFRTGEPREGLRERGRPGEPPETWRVRAVPVLDQGGAVAWVAESLVRLSGVVPELAGRAPALSSGAAFVVIDRSERIVSWSPAAAQVFGHSVEQALGRRIDLIVPPERVEEERSLAARVEAQGRVGRFETVRRARDGRDVPVALEAVALRDEAGALVGRTCVIEDLSTLHQLRGRVAEQEQLLAHITRESADAIIGVDAGGRVTSWNRGAEQLLGLPQEEMLGRSLEGILARPRSAEMLVQLGQRRPVRPQRMEWRDARGETVPVDVSVALLPGPGGGAALVARDLSAQQRLDRQLVRSEKLAVVGSLAAGLAHEIGTPLNVISATAEYLMPEAGREGQERLREIVAETERISRLVRELLSFARGTPPGRVQLRLSEAVERVLRLLRYALEKEQIALTCDVPEGLPALQADPDGVHQVLLNLLMNAVSAVGRGGQVGIRARLAEAARGDRVVVVEVHDDGPGVPVEVRERIFDPFYTTRPEGTGLGLAVCSRIVAEHGGDIQVGEGPLGGASFVVQFPVREEER
ncbi:MAG: PAS domain S-box protein [Deltaproteobacteria bacterium]|nr:PAS domain S-box protein [Deltaproteobacteria bacterium]